MQLSVSLLISSFPFWFSWRSQWTGSSAWSYFGLSVTTFFSFFFHFFLTSKLLPSLLRSRCWKGRTCGLSRGCPLYWLMEQPVNWVVEQGLGVCSATEWSILTILVHFFFKKHIKVTFSPKSPSWQHEMLLYHQDSISSAVIQCWGLVMLFSCLGRRIPQCIWFIDFWKIHAVKLNE